MSLSIGVPEITELTPRILIVGVGGAGGNAVNNMIRSDLEGVEFVVANTDAQALASSLCDRPIQLGTQITQGLGAGARPDIGAAAAQEAIDLLKEPLAGAHMAFITAGMGGGTGTGAAPVIAKLAREQGILTVGVVTKPFQFEGSRRMTIAEQGVEELQKHVDTLIIIPNQNLFRIANEKTTFADAFQMADNVLHSGVRGITDLMVMPGLINLDFADVRTVMMEMGKAMMGTGEAEGETRAIDAAEAAISNPLLDEVSMKGARGVLINITGGTDLTLYEVDEAANRIRNEVDPEANIIVGSTFNEALNGKMRVSVFSTGIEAAEGAASGAATVMPFVAPATPTLKPDPEPFRPSVAREEPTPVVAMRTTDSVDTVPEPDPISAVQTDAVQSEEPLTLEIGDALPIPAAAEDIAVAETSAAPVDAFMPPQPQQPEETFDEVLDAPEPFAEAALTNGTVEEEKPARGPSLFERLSGKGRKDRAQDQQEPAISSAASPTREQAPLTLRSAGAADSDEGGQAAEDQIDIPAFLRRQAN
ncbi:MAG: cell division protein FtsZ [Alphaproteobacteria bacterium]